MSRYRFELASPADDADLRAILADTPMPGAIALGFQREPGFFAASPVEGPFQQVVAARDLTTNRLVGFGCRSIRDRFVNGAVQPIGYLGTLRLRGPHRRHGLVARGYRYFHELHGDGRTRLYLTTIASDNGAAQQVLVGGRAGLPFYHDAGLFHTAILGANARARVPACDGVTIRAATLDDVPMLLAFLNEVGPGRQFFPCYTADDFFTPTGTFLHLRPEDLLLALRDGQFVGTLGAWDQRGYRQTVVQGYTWPMGGLRHLYNLWARGTGAPLLPAAGSTLRLVSAALPLIKDDDAAVFARLLHEQLARLRARRADTLALGLHERDPLLAALRRFPARWYDTRLYHVCWPDGDTLRKTLDARPTYLELGTL